VTISIVYNSYTITEAMQLGKMRFSEGYDKVTLVVEFVLEADTAAALTTACNTARAALTAWDASLVFTFGGTWHTYNPTAGTNTGFLHRPTLEEVGSDLDTETSRHYRWTCVVEKPAGDGGRRSANVLVAWDEYRRRKVILSAVYTATSAGSAYANATTNGPTWAGTILSDLSITNTDRAAETVEYEHQNKLAATYRLEYDEQIEADSAAGHAAGVIGSRLEFQVDMPAEIGTSPLVPVSEFPPAIVTAEYSGTLVTGSWPDGDSARTMYFGTIRPWLLARVRTVLGLDTGPMGGGLYATAGGETFRASRSTGYFSGRVTMLLGGNNPVESYVERIAQEGDVGIAAEKLYDGKDHTWAEWGIGAELFATQVVVIKQRDSLPGDPPGLAPPWVQHGSFGEEMTAEARGVRSVAIGSSGLTTTIVYTKTFTRRYRYALAAEGGGVTTPGVPGGGNVPRDQGGPVFRANASGGISLLGVVAGR